jgi:hypothetical protein
MNVCFQLLTFRTIHFLDLPKANKKMIKYANKYALN